jgi:hypothetical protein
MASEKQEEPSLLHHIRHLLAKATVDLSASLGVFVALVAAEGGLAAAPQGGGSQEPHLGGPGPAEVVHTGQSQDNGSSELLIHDPLTDAYQRIGNGIDQGHQQNQTVDEAISAIRGASGLETLSLVAAKAVLKYIIKKYAQDVLDDLIQDAANKTKEVIENNAKKAAHELRQILSSRQTIDTPPASSDEIQDPDDLLSPDAGRTINDIRDELRRRSETDPQIPLDPRTLSAFQIPAPGAMRALSDFYEPSRAEYIASAVRQLVVRQALKDFPVDAQVRALARIVDTPIRSSTVIDPPSISRNEAIHQLDHHLEGTPYTGRDVAQWALGSSSTLDRLLSQPVAYLLGAPVVE